MKTVTVSARYQVIIPKAVRKMMGVKPGQKMRMIAYDNKVILILVRPVQEARGSLAGIETDVQREERDRI